MLAGLPCSPTAPYLCVGSGGTAPVTPWVQWGLQPLGKVMLLHHPPDTSEPPVTPALWRWGGHIPQLSICLHSNQASAPFLSPGGGGNCVNPPRPPPRAAQWPPRVWGVSRAAGGGHTKVGGIHEKHQQLLPLLPQGGTEGRQERVSPLAPPSTPLLLSLSCFLGYRNK